MLSPSNLNPQFGVWNYMRAVTPSDSVDLELPTNALYIAGGGDVALVFLDDTVVVVPVTTFATLRVRVKRVNATDTDATSIFACY